MTDTSRRTWCDCFACAAALAAVLLSATAAAAGDLPGSRAGVANTAQAIEPEMEAARAKPADAASAETPSATNSPSDEQASESLPPEEGVLRRGAIAPRARGTQQASAAGSPLTAARGTGGSSPRAWYRNGLVALGVVLAIIFGLSWLMKRFHPLRGKLHQGELEIVARTFLGPKQSVAVIRLGQRLVMVGVTPERLTPLAEVADPAESALLLGQLASRQNGSGAARFAPALEREAGAYETEGEEEPAAAGAYGSARRQVRGLIERVRAMGAGGGAGAAERDVRRG